MGHRRFNGKPMVRGATIDFGFGSRQEDTPRPLPARVTDSWRTWVMTGAHAPWKDFSRAMFRQSVGEAVNSLSAQHKHVVKLAYFGGLSNNEIARELDMPVGGVRRRLREALATVNAYIERGQAAGRRVVYGLAGWFAARSIVDHAQRSLLLLVDGVGRARRRTGRRATPRGWPS